jgi:hypothetical protein
MFARRSRRIPVQPSLLPRWPMPAAVTAGLVLLAGIAGCTHSGSTHGAGATGTPTSTQAGAFTPSRLRGALLTRINGVGPAAAADAGSYASLPEVQSAIRSLSAVSVTPKSCEQAMALAGAGATGSAAGHAGSGTAGLATPAFSFGGAPAATVSFRVGQNGVSEVLAAPTDSLAAAALGQSLPTGCAHYSASRGGKTYQYAVQQAWITGIGKQARVTSATATGQPGGNVWSVVYRGSGFVGAITVVGPNASETAVRELAQQAYAYAAQALT